MNLLLEDSINTETGTKQVQPANATTVPTESARRFYVIARAVSSMVGVFISTRSRVLRLERGGRILPANLEDQLVALSRVHHDWNGYDSQAPNDLSMSLARGVVLSSLATIVPTRVVPSAEGGVVVYFAQHGKYADIECLNSGQILGTLSSGAGSDPKVWPIHPKQIAAAIQKIEQFINS
jgi:hypothetical protein